MLAVVGGQLEDRLPLDGALPLQAQPSDVGRQRLFEDAGGARRAEMALEAIARQEIGDVDRHSLLAADLNPVRQLHDAQPRSGFRLRHRADGVAEAGRGCRHLSVLRSKDIAATPAVVRAMTIKLTPPSVLLSSH